MSATTTYPVHRRLQDAAKHGELVVFVDAGASMLCGSPGWDGFASQVVQSLQAAGRLSFLEAEQLLKLDPRRTLSIAITLADEHGVKLDFDKMLHPGSQRAQGVELYQLLSSLRPVFVTTNYDKWLDDEVPPLATGGSAAGSTVPHGPSRRPCYYLKGDLSTDRLTERDAVIHLHGSYTDPSSMIISLRQYIEHYANERVQNFLTEMFKNHTVLFVGYGLAEIEVLDYIVRANKALLAGATEPRHFLLYPHRSTESVQADFVARFFRDQCGVDVIRYCIDNVGYDELVDVFRAWGTQLDVKDPTLLDLQLRIDNIVQSPTTVEREAALRLIKKNPDLENYLLNALKDSIWFDDLDQAGLFAASRVPGVKVISTDKGTQYQADGWPALRYLEQIASGVAGDRAKRVRQILRDITTEATRRSIDNWRTWWSLATILSQLPLDVIEPADIELVGTWLGGKFEANMIAHEIGNRLLPRLLASADQTDWSKALQLSNLLLALRKPEGQTDG